MDARSIVGLCRNRLHTLCPHKPSTTNHLGLLPKTRRTNAFHTHLNHGDHAGDLDHDPPARGSHWLRDQHDRRQDDLPPDPSEAVWYYTMMDAEVRYQELLKNGWSPQQARSVLPNSLKTEIVVTANFREWAHIFDLRCSAAAHPQMREILVPVRDVFRGYCPSVFGEEQDA